MNKLLSHHMLILILFLICNTVFIVISCCVLVNSVLYTSYFLKDILKFLNACSIQLLGHKDACMLFKDTRFKDNQSYAFTHTWNFTAYMKIGESQKAVY